MPQTVGTGATYTPTENDLGKMIRVTVTGVNDAGTAWAASGYVGPIQAAQPENTFVLVWDDAATFPSPELLNGATVPPLIRVRAVQPGTFTTTLDGSPVARFEWVARNAAGAVIYSREDDTAAPWELRVDGVTFPEGTASVTATRVHTDTSIPSVTVTATFTVSAGAVTPLGPTGDFTLAFEDTFTGSTLDSVKWTPNWYFAAKYGAATDPTIHSNAAPTMAAAFDPGQVTVANGVCKLRAEAVPGGIVGRRDSGATATTNVKSGMISSHGKMTVEAVEGTKVVVEASIKMPAHGGELAGLWPAFWLMPDDRADWTTWPSTDATWPPEVDIVEWESSWPTGHWVNYWWRDSPGQLGTSGTVNKEAYPNNVVELHDASTRLTIYTLEWTVAELRYFIDGTLVKTLPAVSGGRRLPQEPMYVILNLEALQGGFLGGTLAPVDPALLPATMEVDYVRAWTAPDTSEPPTLGGAVQVGSGHTSAQTATTLTATLAENCTPGHILVSHLAGDKNLGTVSVGSGWTIPSGGVYSGASTTGAVAYRIAAGNATDKACVWSWTTPHGASAGIVEDSASGSFVSVSKRPDPATDTAVTSVTSPTASAAAAGVAYACVSVDSDQNWSTSPPTWTNDYDLVKVTGAIGTVDTTLTGLAASAMARREVAASDPLATTATSTFSDQQSIVSILFAT